MGQPVLGSHLKKAYLYLYIIQHNNEVSFHKPTAFNRDLAPN